MIENYKAVPFPFSPPRASRGAGRAGRKGIFLVDALVVSHRSTGARPVVTGHGLTRVVSCQSSFHRDEPGGGESHRRKAGGGESGGGEP